MIRMVDLDQPHIWYESCKVCKGVYFDAGEFKDFSKRTFADFFRDLFAKEPPPDSQPQHFILTWLPLFIPAALAAVFSPGPDILYVLGAFADTQGMPGGLLSRRLGFASGLPGAYRVSGDRDIAGDPLHGRPPCTPFSMPGIKAAYLLYLAVRILRDHSAFCS